MNYFIGFLGFLIICSGMNTFLGGADGFLVKHEILYFWKAIGAGFFVLTSILLFIAKIGLKFGVKLKTDINIVFVIVTMFVGVFGAPMLFSVYSPEASIKISSSIFQVGIPMIAFFQLVFSGLLLMEAEKPCLATEPSIAKNAINQEK